MLVVGDDDGATSLATTEILDIDTVTFSPGPVMSLGRYLCATVSLPGSILVVGGWHGSRRCGGHGGGSLPPGGDFRGWANDSSAHGTLWMRRVGAAAKPLHSRRRALVVGGYGEASICRMLTTTEVYVLTAAS